MASEAGISPVDFGRLSYRDLSNHLQGYQKAEREQWKRARLTAYMVYATHAKDPQQIEDWMPLDEVRRVKKIVTKKEYQKVKQAWQA